MSHSRSQHAAQSARSRALGRTSVESAQSDARRAKLDAARRTIAEFEASPGRPASAAAGNADRFQRLFESNSVGIIICDIHGDVTEANDAFLAMLGYEHDDLPLQWDRMTPPEWRDLDAAKVAEIMSTGAGVAWEKQYVARDGRRVPVLIAVALADASRGECVAIVHDLSDRKRLEAEIMERKEQLRALTARMGLAEERERHRIATGLHDGLGHTLALAKLRLGKVPGADHSSEDAQTIRDVDELLDQAIGATRSLTFDLSSPVLYELGFEAALESIGEEMARRHVIRFQFQAERRLPRIDDDLTVMLYRIVRELLHNVTKHAQARSARLCVQVTGDEIQINLADDGVGFDATRAGQGFGLGGGFGLFSVREQLRHVGGRLEIESVPGRGTRVVVVAPLACIENEPSIKGDET